MFVSNPHPYPFLDPDAMVEWITACRDTHTKVFSFLYQFAIWNQEHFKTEQLELKSLYEMGMNMSLWQKGTIGKEGRTELVFFVRLWEFSS